MAINVQHLYSTHVTVNFYADDAVILHHTDCGTMDEIAERACVVLVKHNFTYADVCSAATGEVLITLERI